MAATWMTIDIVPARLPCPSEKPQMSFTGTGFEVTSSGGSFAGRMVSLTLLTKLLYHGTSTADRSRSRCRSGSFGVPDAPMFLCDGVIQNATAASRATVLHYVDAASRSGLQRLALGILLFP